VSGRYKFSCGYANIYPVDIKASSTASDPWTNGLNISYLDGSGAFGDLFTDSLTVAGTKLDSYTVSSLDCNISFSSPRISNEH